MHTRRLGFLVMAAMVAGLAAGVLVAPGLPSVDALDELEHVVRLGCVGAVRALLEARGHQLPADVRARVEAWLCEDATGPLAAELVERRAAALAVVVEWAERRPKGTA